MSSALRRAVLRQHQTEHCRAWGLQQSVCSNADMSEFRTQLHVLCKDAYIKSTALFTKKIEIIKLFVLLFKVLLF